MKNILLNLFFNFFFLIFLFLFSFGSEKKEVKDKKSQNHFFSTHLNFQYLEEIDHLISSLPHFGLNLPIDLQYFFQDKNWKHQVDFQFNVGNYFTFYQNRSSSQYIQNTGINLQLFLDYQFLKTIFRQSQIRILLGAWLGNSFSLVTPPYLAYNYSLFHTLGIAMEWHSKIKKNTLLVGGKLSMFGFGFRPSWTGYDFGLEKTLEENGILSVVGYSYGKYTRFVFWHNYIRLHPSVEYQFYLNELLNFSLKYNLNITAIFFPQMHFSMRHTLGIGLIFKW